MQKQSFSEKFKVPAFRDAVFIGIFTGTLLILGFSGAGVMDWTDTVANYLHENKKVPLDDIIITLSFLSILLIIYGIRRNTEKMSVISLQSDVHDRLEKTQANLQILLKSSSSIIFNTSTSDGFPLLYMTENITGILGYEKEEYYELGFWINKIHPEDQPSVYAIFPLLFSSGYAAFDYRFMHKNGSWLWMHSTCQIKYDDKGNPMEIFGTWWDISEEKIAQETLRQNNERVQMAFKATRDTIYDWDLITNDLWMSDEIYHSYGYNKESIVMNLGWWESKIHPEDHDPVFADVMNTLTAKKSNWTGEYRFQCDDGSYKNIIDRGFIMYSSEGVALRWTGSMSDVTEQKATEKLVLIANERFELASKASTDTIYDRNLVTNELWMSDEIFRSFGYDHEPNMNLQWLEDKIHPEDYDAITQTLNDVKNRRLENWSESYRLRRADGTYAYVNDRRHIMYNAEGKPIRGTGSMTDITKIKETQLELTLAKEKAEDSVKFKSEFLANMSHEIRTPLNGIIGMTELALETNINTQQKRYLENIQFSSETLFTLINDILDFSKIDAGKLELSPIEFSLRDEIPKSLQGLSLKASEKKLEFIFCLPQNVPDLFFGDVFRLQQIILNLAGNAIKFTDQGEVAVNCELKSIAQEKALLQFSVSDSGIGISSNNLTSIFSAFIQADGSVTRQYGGTGLGLAITRNLVEMMGGKIWAESEEGKGSTFHFTICMQLQNVEAQPRYIVDNAIDGKRVLIIEDNKATRDYTLQVINQFGMDGFAVSTAERAMMELNNAVQQQKPYDLVLLDINLGSQMDGFDIVLEMQKNPAYKKTKIIVITMSQKASDRERFGQLGITEFFSKPFSQSDVLDSIQNLFVTATPGFNKKAELSNKLMEANTTGSLRVLLVEDNIINQEVASSILIRLGNSVTIANNGIEALEILDNKQFDIVLMDVQMPKMNGYDATTKIREAEISTGKHVHIIGLTANAMKGDKEKCLSIGMDDYVSKPIRINDMTKAIERFTNKINSEKQEEETRTEEKPLINLEALFENLNNDEEIFEQFMFKIPEHLLSSYQDLEAAVTSKKVEDIVYTAHALRGLCLHLDMFRVTDLSLKIEMLASENEFSIISKKLPVLKNELMKGLDCIKKRKGLLLETA